MPGLNLEGFGDLLTTTQKELGEPNFTDLMSDSLDYPCAKVLLKKHKMSVQSGPQIQWSVAVNFGQQAENLAIDDHDSVSIEDSMVQALLNWRKTGTKYAFYHEEMDFNAGARQIVDLIKFKRIKSQVAWLEKLESNFIDFPLASDTRTPFGLPYWITKNATEGFNGGIPSGYSAVANLSPTTYPRWNNWTAQYTYVTPDDLFRKAKKMATRTGFKPAVEGTPTFNKGDKLAYLGNYSVISQIEEQLEARNENLGADLDPYHNRGTLRNAALTYVPRLDLDTTDPLYQINWGVFEMIVKSKWWMRETNISNYPGQRNVTAVFVDSIYNFICRDRRRCGVIALGTSYPS